ncbi:MAG: replicative DNA helicase [Massiliimalia sp.]|jgi:replicative DNA helicase
MTEQVIINPDAELGLIGCILVDFQYTMERVGENTKPDFFSNRVLASVYQLAENRFDSGQNDLDTVSLMEGLKGRFSEDQVKPILVQALERVPSVQLCQEYADAVRASFQARECQKIYLDGLAKIKDTGQIEQNMESAAEQLDRLLNDRRKSRLVSVKESILDAYRGAFESRKGYRLDTGFSELDVFLDGLFPSDFAILAARPGVGKSVMALTVARNVAEKAGKTVAYYSLEMSVEQMNQRLLAMAGQVPLKSIKNGSVCGNDIQKLGAAADHLARLPIQFVDDAAITVEDIRRDCRRVKNLGLIIVDYVQLMTPKGRFATRNDAVGSISRSLRVLAMDLNVPVLALSQMNRESENYEKPRLSDLRESGSLEQDATTVMAMWKQEEPGLVNVSILKNRNGETGKTSVLSFAGATMTMRQAQMGYEEPKRRGKRFSRPDSSGEVTF